MIRKAVRGVVMGAGGVGRGLGWFSEGRRETGGKGEGEDRGKKEWEKEREEEERRERRKDLVQRFTMMTLAGVSGFFLYNYLYGDDKTPTKPIQQ